MTAPGKTLLVSCAAWLALAAGASAGPADDLSRATLAALPALDVSSATIGAAREEGATAVLGPVTFASRGERPIGVTIARVAVTGGLGSGDAVQGARIVLEGLEGTGADGQSFRSERVELSGTQGSLAAVLASLATRQPFFQGANAAAVTGYSAERIDIASLTLARRQRMRTEEASYRAIAMTRYVRGRIDEMVIAGGAVRTIEGPDRTAEFGRSRFVGFNAAAGTATGNATTVALESGTMEQLRGTGDGGAPFSIERLEFGRISMRPGERSLMDLSQSVQEMEPTEANEEARRRTMGVVAELFSRLDMTHLEMVNFRGQDRTGRAFAIGRFALSDLAEGRIGRIAFADLSAPGNLGQAVRIGRFALEGVDASGLVGLGREVAAGRIAPGAPPPPSAYPEVRRLTTEGIDVRTPDGRTLASLGRFEVESGPRIGLVPTRIRARLTDLVAPIEDAERRAQLAPLGLADKITLGGELEIDYVEAAREIRLRALSIDTADVGALTLAMTIGGIDRAQIEALPGSAAALGLSARAGRTVLSFREAGGVAAFLGYLAQQSGISEDEVVEQMKAQVGAVLGHVVQDQALVAQASQAVSAFLDDPRSLTIALAPRGEVPLAALAMTARVSPLALLPMFDIDIKANE